MKFTEYCDVINCNIELTYYHNQNKRWCAAIDGAEVKEDGLLLSAFLNGETPDEALKNYIASIRGKTIVFNSNGGDKRREYVVPETIEA